MSIFARLDGGDTSVIDMTTESRPGKDTDVGEEIRKIATTTKAKPTDFAKPKGDKAASAPKAQAHAAPPAPARTYTVKSGDTLWDIAVSHYGDGRQYRKIASANNIADPNRIDAGLELTIPQ